MDTIQVTPKEFKVIGAFNESRRSTSRDDSYLEWNGITFHVNPKEWMKFNLQQLPDLASLSEETKQKIEEYITNLSNNE